MFLAQSLISIPERFGRLAAADVRWCKVVILSIVIFGQLMAGKQGLI
jgi:hypothetical protein